MSRTRLVVEMLIIGIGEALVGRVATFYFAKAAKDDALHDAGILAIWLAVLVGGVVLLAVRWWPRQQEDKIAAASDRVAVAVPDASVAPPTRTAIKTSGKRTRIVDSDLRGAGIDATETAEDMSVERTRVAIPNAGPFRFEDRALILDNPRIDLTELFQKRSASFKVTFGIRNVSGYPVEITDLDGEITLNPHDEETETCREGRRFGKAMRLEPRDYYGLTIVQPVPGDLRDLLTQVLQSDARWVQFNFPLTFIGNVEGPNGTEPFVGCSFRADSLYVRGPVRDTDPATQVQHWSSVLADAKVYNNLGLPVEKD